ncbi:SagB/ThcOx family dehydrogenase [Actinomadura sp. ATCC 31491]|uniref:SagB/ThcOx family dehydrogenase n=1 Tax=Actinomadura luzonensis TaxID=2805427 RepID=A0ABT0FU21_9ACTN|nr:SagB/ThcOx family dehydrogenase [Actinomadura luzonensis]MCK2215759.1 SagB/ThcOx family dehydrogenase [Actinomadura luzonensis]
MNPSATPFPPRDETVRHDRPPRPSAEPQAPEPPASEPPAPERPSPAPPQAGPRLRRRRCLVCYWHQGAFVAHPYPDGEPVTLPPDAAALLAAFDDWTTPDQAAAGHPPGGPPSGPLTGDAVRAAVEVLRRHHLLLAEHSPQAEADARVAHEWRSWEPEAPFFHYATQDTITAGNVDAPMPGIERLPAIFTEHPGADRLLLPRRPADLATPYGQVLHGRRTCFGFTADPVALPTLAALLHTCFAPVDYIDAGELAGLYRRTSPAGGARQELDPYLAVRNVEGVTPGIYHYNVREHSLELLAEGCTREEAAHLCAGQDTGGQAAFLIVLVAVIERMRAKYRTPRCYRVSLLNAGHLGQTFALTATALGLGAWQTGAFHDTAVAERLGLDNSARTPLYVLAAGHPGPAPADASPPATLTTFRATRLTT